MLNPRKGAEVLRHNASSDFMTAYCSFRQNFLETMNIDDVRVLVDALKFMRGRDAVCVFRMFVKMGHEQSIIMFCFFAFFAKFEQDQDIVRWIPIFQLALAHEALIPVCFRKPRTSLDLNALVSVSFLESLHLGQSGGLIDGMVTDVTRATYVGLIWTLLAKEHCRREGVPFENPPPLFIKRDPPFFGVMTELNAHVSLRYAVSIMRNAYCPRPWMELYFYVERRYNAETRQDRMGMADKWLRDLFVGKNRIRRIRNVDDMLWYLFRENGVGIMRLFDDCVIGIEEKVDWYFSSRCAWVSSCCL